MIEAGFASSRSKAGVKVNNLAAISRCSLQMARRYALGEALPDIETTYKIAAWLKVTPGWLLFGEEPNLPNNLAFKELIQIDHDLLQFILQKTAALYSTIKDTEELTRFIIDIIHDATHMEAERKTIFKMIEFSINSALRFNGEKNGSKVKSQLFNEV